MAFTSILKPVVLAFICVVILQYSGTDLYLSELIYYPAQQWQFKQSWLLNSVIHHGGRDVIGLVVVFMLGVALRSFLPRYRQHIYNPVYRYVAFATIMSMVAVSMLKQLTTLPCPWDLFLFGGERTNILLERAFSTSLPIGHCFPSGHASGGFALFSLYFAARAISSIRQQTGTIIDSGLTQNKWLLPGMLTGIIFGVAQQMRGAHFLSHDVASAAVCWLVCGMLAYVMLPQDSLPRENQNVIRVPSISAD